jgi:PEP-CTERM motif
VRYSLVFLYATLQVILAPSAVSATAFDLLTSFGDGFGGFGTPVIAQVNQDTSPASISNSFTSSQSGAAGSGTTTGSASATASFNGGLVLGAFSTVDVSATNLTLVAFDYRGQSLAFAQFSDMVTLSGGTPGTTGYLRIVFGLDGSFVALADDVGGAGASLTIDQTDSTGVVQVVGVQHSDFLFGGSGVGGFPVPLPATLTLDFQYLFGVPGTFGLSLAAQSDVAMENTGSGSATVDFGSTVSMLSLEILDAEKSPIAGGSVFSQDGFTYNPAASVPEPASWLLLASGVVAVIAGRRARHRRERLTTLRS